MAREDPPAVARVKDAVTSTSSCSSATLEELKILFADHQSLPKHGAQKTKPETVKQSRSRNATTTSASGRTALGKSRKPKVAPVEVHEEPKQSLPSSAKFRLATEIVNAALKSLSDTIKAKQAKSQLVKRRASGVSSLVQDTQNPMALQPRSVNRIPKTKEKSPSSLRAPSTRLSGESIEIEATAECARLAFATLRKLGGQQDQTVQLPPLQLETGMSSLISKMIALGLDDLATKELRILVRRLSAVIRGSEEAVKAKYHEDEPIAPIKYNLADLLRFENPSKDLECLSLVVASQLQVLKLMVSKKRRSTIEAALEHLESSAPHSPLNLISFLGSKEPPQSSGKAAQQLEMVSRLLLSLCSATGVADDDAARSGVLPPTAFQIQLLSIEATVGWWKLSGHRGDPERELVEPFARYLRCFSRRSLSPASETYRQAKDSHIRFKTILSNFSPSMTSESIFLNIHKILARIAQDCIQTSEALEWMKKSIPALRKQNLHGSGLCSMLCQSLTIHLQAVLDNNIDVRDWKEMVTMFKETNKILEHNVKGNQKDLEELLMSMHCLRKQLLSVISRRTTSRAPDEISWPVEFLQQAVGFICQGIKFLIQFHGTEPAASSPSDTGGHYIQSFYKMVKPTVDSILALATASTLKDAEMWRIIGSALNECREFFTKFGSQKASTDSLSIEAQFLPSPWVLLSNAYWCIYIQKMQKAGHTPDIWLYLETSIDLIRYQPLPERTAGFLIQKHEKLGLYFEWSGGLENSREQYALAVLGCIEIGNATDAAKQASLTSLGRACEQEPLVHLKRLLSSFLRVALKLEEKNKDFKCLMDVEDLPDIERATLTEVQLIIMENFLRNRSSVPVAACVAISNIADRALSFYTVSKYPIRRLRVLVRLSYLLITYPVLHLSGLFGGVQAELTHGLPESFGDDLELRCYRHHLLASRKICVAISGELPDMETITQCLEQWLNSLKPCSSIECLQGKVDDIPQWLRLLDALDDYLHMQGFEIQRVTVLFMIARIQELRLPEEVATYTASLLKLGQQYLRLGHREEADSQLQAARRQMDSWKMYDIKPVCLQWHLISAEYAIKTGNLKKGLVHPTPSRPILTNFSEEHIANAKTAILPVCTKEKFRGQSSTEQCDSVHTMASMCYVESLLNVERNEHSPALYNASRGVQLIQRAWNILECRYDKDEKAAQNDFVGFERTATTALMDNLGQISFKVKRPSAPTTANFWSLVPCMVEYNLHLSRLNAHRGLLQEARHCANQALKSADAAKARPLQIRCHISIADLNIQSNRLADAIQDIQRASAVVNDFTPSHLCARLQIFLAMIHSMQHNSSEEDLAVRLASKYLEKVHVLPSVGSMTEPDFDRVQDVASQLQAVSLKEPIQRSKISKNKQKTLTESTKNSSINTHLKEAPKASQVSQVGHNLLHIDIRQQLLYCQILSAFRRNKSDKVASLLAELARLPPSQSEYVRHKLFEAEYDIRRALLRMNKDPVYCVINESTISCPSINLTGRRRSKEHITTLMEPQQLTLQSKKLTGRGKTKPADADFEEPLSKAIVTLQEMHSFVRAGYSSATSHKISDRLGTALMTLSVVWPIEAKVEVNPGYLTYAKEFGRSFASLKEISAVHVEKTLRERADKWIFEEHDMVGTSDGEPENLNFQLFHENYIDIIPASWSVISISLSANHKELCLSKLRSKQAPFILTIPLNRQNPHDGDQDSFGYVEGKAALVEIIDLANRTTDSANVPSGKGGKKKWWEQRIALDARLKELLENIEETWLGGFRGLFAQGFPQYDLLSRFQQSFYRILDKHLPSRRKSGKSVKAGHIALDSRVLELFVGLGNPNDSGDLDEAVIDLLYFVVDILQFQGERNAYDEIDFDVVRDII